VSRQKLIVTPYKTPVLEAGDDLLKIITQTLPKLEENSFLVVTSKVVALWENRVVRKHASHGQGSVEEKYQLVVAEAEKYLPAYISKYQMMLTIKGGCLAVNAGIDESNINHHYYVLLPSDPFASAEKIWRFCRQQYQLKNLGVIITDSRSAPLKWGRFGTSLGHCGFKAIKDQVGVPDLFGVPLKMTQINLAESIAQAAVLMMGEANESQPLATVSGLPGVEFVDKSPDEVERQSVTIEIEDDIYEPLLNSVDWQSKDN